MEFISEATPNLGLRVRYRVRSVHIGRSFEVAATMKNERIFPATGYLILSVECKTSR